jgi:hypothetical protein
MVNTNNTRATSKKIKDLASLKSKSDNISVANVLIPPTNTTGITPAGTVASTAQANSGSPLSASQAPSGSPLSGTQAPSGSPLNPLKNGNTIFKNTLPNGKLLNSLARFFSFLTRVNNQSIETHIIEPQAFQMKVILVYLHDKTNDDLRTQTFSDEGDISLSTR